jgi:hypothetical protein
MHQPPRYTIGPENLIFVVLQEDAPTHDNEHPFCGDDPDCPCRSDSDLVREYVTKPLDNGLLTNAEAMRLYWGKQLGHLHDAPITDEPSITDRHNEWNGYEQAMAWEAAEEEWRRATDDRDFEQDDLVHTDEHPYCDDLTCWCHRCEQEIPFTDEEIEAIMSEPTDNKDANDLAEISKRAWLSEHL